MPLSAYNVGDPGSIPRSVRSPGEGNGNPTSVFLPGKSHRWRGLVGCSPWGCKDLDTTERLHSLTMVALRCQSLLYSRVNQPSAYISSLLWVSFPLRSGFPSGSEVPAIWETWDPSLGQEDPLEKGMTTHSSILAWGIVWTEEPGEQQSMGSQRVRHD